MRRRDVIATLSSGAVLLVGPTRALAQLQRARPLVGCLDSSSSTTSPELISAFTDGLREPTRKSDHPIGDH
jgi:hypothetical protein